MGDRGTESIRKHLEICLPPRHTRQRKEIDWTLAFETCE
jgi:hypothetical protein